MIELSLTFLRPKLRPGDAELKVLVFKGLTLIDCLSGSLWSSQEVVFCSAALKLTDYSNDKSDICPCCF